MRHGLAHPRARVELVGDPCIVIEQGRGVDGRELDRTHRRKDLLHARAPAANVPDGRHDAAEYSATE
jgi:hypothetical protein